MYVVARLKVPDVEVCHVFAIFVGQSCDMRQNRPSRISILTLYLVYL